MKNRNRIQISSDHRGITEFLRTKTTDKKCLTKSYVFNCNNYTGHNNSIQGTLGKEKDQLFHNLSFHYKICVTGWPTCKKKILQKKTPDSKIP